MKKYILFALVVSLSAFNANAQEKTAATAKEKSIDRVATMVENATKMYDLDAKQVAQVTKIYEDSEAEINVVKETLIALRNRKVNLDGKDQKAVDAFNADYAEALKSRKSVLVARTEAIDAILTDEQKAKVNAAGPVKKAK